MPRFKPCIICYFCSVPENSSKKTALVSVINDLVTDNRVNKTCLTLLESDYDVTLIGRKLKHSLPLPDWNFNAERMKLIFTKGAAFYLFFNLRLFFKLLFKKADLLYANDLDTLLPNYLVSKIKNIPLIYDSHELFTEVPELQNSKLKRQIWKLLEKFTIPKLKYCITVNDSIAKIYEELYNTKFHVVRNIPEATENFKPKSKQELNLPLDKKIILLQGAGINVDRGAEELIDAMNFVEGAILYIIGSGDVWGKLKEQVKRRKLENKIVLIHKIPKSELMNYTHHADIGLSIDKNTNLNYYYSLPNKLFDYIHAGVPILASRLPEIEKIILQYNIGDFIEDHKTATIAHKLNELLSSPKLQEYKQNTFRAAKELNWELEKENLIRVIKSVTN